MSSISSVMPRMKPLTSSMTLSRRRCISSGPSWSSEMRRSTLLMNSAGLTPSRSLWRRTVSVWGIAPSTASTTTSAPSTAHRSGDVATEVDVARRVDEVDEVVPVLVLVRHGDVRGVDGDTALLLVLLGVHHQAVPRPCRRISSLRPRAGCPSTSSSRGPREPRWRCSGCAPGCPSASHILQRSFSSAHYTAGYR